MTNMEVVEGVRYPGSCRGSVFGARSWMTQVQVELESSRAPNWVGRIVALYSFFLSFLSSYTQPTGSRSRSGTPHHRQISARSGLAKLVIRCLGRSEDCCRLLRVAEALQ